MKDWRSDTRMGERLLREHSNRQVQAERRKRKKREQRNKITISIIDMKDVYLPPPHMPNKPHTYGVQKQFTVIRKGRITGTEVAF